MQLRYGKKTVCARHRRFHKLYHSYQQLKKAFNGEQENEIVLNPLIENEVYERVENIRTIFGKTQKKDAS